MKRIRYILAGMVLLVSLTACEGNGGESHTPTTTQHTSSIVTTMENGTQIGHTTRTTTGITVDSSTSHSRSSTSERATTTVQPTTTGRRTTTKSITTNPKNTTTKKTTTGQTTTAISDSNYQTEVLRLVNIERDKAGLDPLTYYPAAQAAADTRAAEIHEQWSHTRPNGESCFTALTDIGIYYQAAGENIAMGYRTPAAVVEGWMNSPGHRENILNENFTHIVIGFNNYGWVQLFITPL